MNGYLVVGRCGMDDVPLALLCGEKEARDFASTVAHQQVLDAVADVYGTDATEAITVCIVPFIAGAPQPAIFTGIDLDT
jgi:hypothetical protein